MSPYIVTFNGHRARIFASDHNTAREKGIAFFRIEPDKLHLMTVEKETP